jgi:hypothetical protein
MIDQRERALHRSARTIAPWVVALAAGLPSGTL